MAEVRDTDRGWREIRQRLRDGRGLYAKAGVVGEKASATHDGSDLTNVDLGLVHEFGSEAAHVPERSFVRSAFDKHHEKYEEHAKKLAGAVIDGKITIEKGLAVLGMEAAADIKNGILEGAGIPPPNTDETIAAKGSSRPLVASGQLIGAISSEVVRG